MGGWERTGRKCPTLCPSLLSAGRAEASAGIAGAGAGSAAPGSGEAAGVGAGGGGPECAPDSQVSPESFLLCQGATDSEKRVQHLTLENSALKQSLSLTRDLLLRWGPGPPSRAPQVPFTGAICAVWASVHRVPQASSCSLGQRQETGPGQDCGQPVHGVAPPRSLGLGESHPFTWWLL